MTDIRIIALLHAQYNTLVEAQIDERPDTASYFVSSIQTDHTCGGLAAAEPNEIDLLGSC